MPKEKGPEEGQKKNIRRYQVKPLGILCMVQADLLSAKDASGGLFLPHINKIDDVLDKGTVLAVGPEVKAVKPGDRVQYLFNSFFELDQFYRENFNHNAHRKGIVKEGDIVAIIEPIKEGAVPVTSDKNTDGAYAEGLVPDDHSREREKKLRGMEARAKIHS